MNRRLVKEPFPHVLVESRKELHGWYRDERECTSERMLINPYNGCANDCLYCYAKSYGGYFRDHREEGLVTVFKDFDKVVASQLDSLGVASCGYLSPVTDPFQGLEEIYHLSMSLVRVFTERRLPIEFITKSRVPPGVLELMSRQEHSFGQISITTIDEKKRRILMKEGAPTDELWEQVTAIRRHGMHAVVRIDPIIPFVTDSRDELRELLLRVCDRGACHVVASVMDVPVGMAPRILDGLRGFGAGTVGNLRKLYCEKIWGSLNASAPYRRDLFSFLRRECDRLGVTFALCMEYELLDGEPSGMNGEFMSSRNCEGIDIPVYVRDGEVFRPAVDCTGNCLSCETARCGLDELALARTQRTRKSFKLSDYRRWSRERPGVGEGDEGTSETEGVRSCREVWSHRR